VAFDLPPGPMRSRGALLGLRRVTARRVLVGIVVALLGLQGISAFRIFQGGKASPPRNRAALIVGPIPKAMPVPRHKMCPSNQLISVRRSCGAERNPILAAR
jgi:hypothetical protein